ncbi:MAG: alpha/beta hydrolase [Myxococcales bacterium]|nr:alpha/beta hydrolase [Myxococcales bacterium]
MKRRSQSQWITQVAERLLTLGRLHPQVRSALATVEVVENVPYREGGNRFHQLDIWRMKTRKSTLQPAVFLIHGGGFRMFSRRTHWWFALNFAKEGYTVFSIDYRLAPESPFPAAIMDVCDAYRWVIQTASRWQVDGHAIALAGESAGANLLLALTLANCFSGISEYAQSVYELNHPPRAALPICGLLQVTQPERFALRPMPRLFRNRIYVTSQSYSGSGPKHSPLLDPLVFLESTQVPDRPLPPMYLAVGTHDPIEDDTLRLATALHERNILHELDIYPGEPHAFHALGWRPAAQSSWAAQRQFLRRHLVTSPDT